MVDRRVRRGGAQTQTLGSVVYKTRRALKLTQKQLGAHVGVTNNAVSRIEGNKVRPHDSTLMMLAEVLDLDYRLLLKLAALNVNGHH